MRGVFENKTQLFTTLCRDVKSFASRWSFCDESSFQRASSSDALWYQLFLKVLIHQPREPTAWKDMLEECRSFYRRGQGTLKAIDSFEKDYTADDAIQYYSQDSFVYRIINCALRTHNINIIVKFQTYIRDLHNELHKWYRLHHLDCFNKRRLPIRIVYRGQYMHETELDRLRELCRSANSQVVLNVFGSATHNPKVALEFIPDERPGYIRCLYQIIVPRAYFTDNDTHFLASCQYFVDIAAFTPRSREIEVLFGVGCLFLIKYVGTPTARHAWTPIILELNINNDGFDPYWSVLSARIQNETSETKRQLLQLVQTYEPEISHVNWTRWWQQLERACGSRKEFDEPIVVIMYELLGDSKSISTALELRKRLIIHKNPTTAQSVEESVTAVLSCVKFQKPPKIIALYEIFLETCNGPIESLKLRPDDLAKIFEYAGDAYAQYVFYTEKALTCYRQALAVTQLQSDPSKNDRVQSKITKITSSTSVHRTNQSKAAANMNQTPHIAFWSDLETDHEQWLISRLIYRTFRQSHLQTRARGRLKFLYIYMQLKEKWIDHNDTWMLLSSSTQQQQQQEVNPLTDFRALLFLAVWSRMHQNGSFTDNNEIHLWHYEKLMFEWLSLNDLKRMLVSYKVADPISNVSIRPILDRVIAKLQLLIIGYILIISVSPMANSSASIVNINRLELVDVARTTISKLAFFDDRDEITQDTVRAELESLTS